MKVPRGKQEPGKGGFWDIDPSYYKNNNSSLVRPSLECPPRKRRRGNKNTKIQIKFLPSDEGQTGGRSVSREELQSPLMPTCATATDSGISLTYSLPAKQAKLNPSSPAINPGQGASNCPLVYEDVYTDLDVTSLPVLTVIKQHDDVLQSFLSFSTPVDQQPSPAEDSSCGTVSSLIKALRPVPLSQIPAELLSRPPPVILCHSEPASPVPGTRMEDEEDILDTLSTNFDVPLYSCPGADWTKIPYGGQDSSNEAASPDSSFIDQSWDETQTLPLFEPTLDFEACLMDLD